MIVVAGPTASGKSALAAALALALGGEVVSADSQQVYQGFDIGTAKPTPDELALAPHHLISILDAREARMDAARYADRADAAIREIAARDHVAIVAGGTGLYLRALLHGVMDAPGRDQAFRDALRIRAAEVGWPALHAELAEKDPEAAAAITPQDRVRIERALELIATTGQRASELRKAHGFLPARYEFLGLRLELPREELYARIDARTQAMFDGGLVEETERLLSQGLDDAPPMASIGYLQARAVLRGELTREQAVADTAQQTRKYAKRQLTWFKKEPGFRAIAAPDAEGLARLIDEAHAFLRR
ncbi:MAG: tRNA (adenosine(37)-N6)-dimethylallyltransferase MiaA [Deltaproteobacteria bacterium]|nr:tRNA (adenosine(37)-N6)-dimethylallyltransferase MiaA [Deltaproteobacteria bacterium]